MSLDPVSLVSPRVSFRGENDNKADIINAPGKFAVQPDEGDKVEISNSNEAAITEEPGKSNLWKNIGIAAGAVVVALGASFGMFKWKGDKWLMPEAKGLMANIKKAIVKPGQWIDENIIKKLANRGSKAANEAADAGEEAAGATTKPVGEAAEGAATKPASEAAEGAATKPASEAAEGTAKPTPEAAPTPETPKTPEAEKEA